MLPTPRKEIRRVWRKVPDPPIQQGRPSHPNQQIFPGPRAAPGGSGCSLISKLIKATGEELNLALRLFHQVFTVTDVAKCLTHIGKTFNPEVWTSGFRRIDSVWLSESLANPTASI